MNKEKEALLKAVLTEPEDMPHKVSMRSIQRLLERMKPQTEEMRNYLIAFYSAETHAQSRAVHEAIYAKFTAAKTKAFDEAYYQCLLNDLGISEDIPKYVSTAAFAPSV
jgi:glycyl-tRNA synthetase (class II)